MRTICTATAGWGQWQCVSRSEDSLCLVYEHRSGVYHYRISQAFHLTADTLTVTLSVTNQGAETLPFGTGLASLFSVVTTNADSGAGEAVTGWSGSSGWRVSFASSYRKSWISASSRRCRTSG
ncbi:putative aldose 1-epimerase [Escherichia coli]|uniref:Putative aldose 1-epimerase n=1 Tax=Escherichia coli TaxID=562 RepID=A0A376SB29_ECOLX|nr:putative aldose 1-epimerase [Escherichia coli]